MVSRKFWKWNNTTVTNSKIFNHIGCYRKTSYPFISGDTFRAMAHHVFDETTSTADWSAKIQRISNGDIVFLKTDYLCDFFSLFTNIPNKFILITHNGDVSAPGQYKTFLSSKKLLGWFASNPDHTHPKLFPIPIGLANTYVAHGNMPVFLKAFKQYVKPYAAREIFVYINFQLHTNAKLRTSALAHFQNFSRAHVAEANTPFDRYLQDLGNARFVLSPPGNGLDCHRTWETLLMGAVPIVLSSTLDPLFSNTPVVISSAWNEVSETSLYALNTSLSTSHISTVLLAQYWHSKITLLRYKYQQRRNTHICAEISSE
jgi:hypothetical protein